MLNVVMVLKINKLDNLGLTFFLYKYTTQQIESKKIVYGNFSIFHYYNYLNIQT